MQYGYTKLTDEYIYWPYDIINILKLLTNYILWSVLSVRLRICADFARFDRFNIRPLSLAISLAYRFWERFTGIIATHR